VRHFLAVDCEAYRMTGAIPPESPQLLQAGLTGPDPSKIADLGSIFTDLAFARDTAEGYATLAQDSNDMEAPGALVAQALWNASVISYRRAFGTGKAMLDKGRTRLRLSRDGVGEAADLSEEQRQAHRLALQLADQHVAHRVGEQDDARVVALLAPPPSPKEIVGVGVFWIRMTGPDPEVAVRLTEVCNWLLGPVQAEIEQRREALLNDLTSRADLDPYYAAAESPTPS